MDVAWRQVPMHAAPGSVYLSDDLEPACHKTAARHSADPALLPGAACPCPPAPCWCCCCCLQMMQEWLAARQLDRKALDALARNVAQIQAWHLHSRLQGGAAGGQAGSRGRKA